MFGTDFWLGYMMGSSEDNNNNHSNNEKHEGVFFITLVLIITIGFFVPAIGILGYEIGEQIRNINFFKWGMSIAFIYFLTFKSIAVIGYPYRKISKLFSNTIILDTMYLFLLLQLGYYFLVIESKIDFISDNKILNELIRYYENIFTIFVNWLINT